MEFANLRRMADRQMRAAPVRPDFHVVAVVRAGTGRYCVDFVEGGLEPGSVVWVRPGQVHQWPDVDRVTGDLVLFTATAVREPAAARIAADPFGPPAWLVSPARRSLVWWAADHLRAELASAAAECAESTALEATAGLHGAAAHTPPIPQALLAVLLLRCAGESGLHRGPGQGDGDPVFRAFRDAVEADFPRHRSVRHYAHLLGYDARTLSRATHRAAGISSKAYIDQRLVLEAKRLLAHSDLSVARCAQRLGFDDPANFTAYFRRATGKAPGAWRRRYSHGPVPGFAEKPAAVKNPHVGRLNPWM